MFCIDARAERGSGVEVEVANMTVWVGSCESLSGQWIEHSASDEELTTDWVIERLVFRYGTGCE